MSISLKDLTIRGRNGQRVPVKDCEFQPLNLLLPGAAPIVVPNKRTKPKAKLTSPADDDDDDYAADADEEETQPLVKKNSAGKAKAKDGRLRSNSAIKERAIEAKKRKKVEQHLQEAEEGQKRLAARFVEQNKYIMQLNAQVHRGDKKVAPAESSKKNEKVADRAPAAKKANTKKKMAPKKVMYAMLPSSDDEDPTTTGEISTTEASSKMRGFLTNMKIRAGGRNTAPAPFTPSEDSHLLVLKKANETWATIATAMGRPKGELTKRYKHLQNIGAKVPGEDDADGNAPKGEDDVGAISSDVATAGDTTTDGETSDAEKTDEETTDAADKSAEETTDAEKTDEESTDVEKTGEETTDADKTGDETTNAEKTDAENTDTENKDEGFLGDVPFGTDLFTLEETAAAEAVQEPKKSKKGIIPDKGKKQKWNKAQPASSSAQKPPSPPLDSNKVALIKEVLADGNDDDDAAGYNAGASEDANETGTKSYIGQYGRQVIADHCAGRVRLPEPDHHFNADDCVLLALVERGHRTNRWLDIQADFANTTGRLIPEEVLKWKLGEGEKPENY